MNKAEFLASIGMNSEWKPKGAPPVAPRPDLSFINRVIKMPDHYLVLWQTKDGMRNVCQRWQLRFRRSSYGDAYGNPFDGRDNLMASYERVEPFLLVGDYQLDEIVEYAKQAGIFEINS